MKIKLNKNLKTFVTIMDMASKVNHEAKISFGKDNMSTILSSGGNSAMEIIIPKEFFDEYDAEDIVGINLNDFVKPLKKMIAPVVIEELDNRLLIKNFTDKLKLPIIEDVKTYDKMPNINCVNKFIIPFSNFVTAISKIGDISKDTIKLYNVDGKVFLSGINGQKEVEIEIGTCIGDKHSVTLGTIYVAPLLVSSEDKLEICFETGKPVVFKYEKSDAKFTYVIAPRIDND